MSKIHFRPVQGPEERIKDFPQTEGYFYVATDTGRIYLDTANENKLPIGSSGVQVIYGTDDNAEIEYDIDDNPVDYLIQISKLSTTNYHINDLILNSDGCFYRIIGTGLNEEREECVKCVKLTVGGGDSDTEKKILGSTSLILNCTQDILNDEKASVTVLVKCRTIDNVPQSESVEGQLTVSQQSKSGEGYEVIWQSDKTIFNHNMPQIFDLTSVLRDSTTHQISFDITNNPDPENNKFLAPTKRTVFITKHALDLSWKEDNFSNTYPFDTGSVRVAWSMTSGVERFIEVYFDDYLVLDKEYKGNNINTANDDFTITADTQILSGSKVTTLKNYFTHGEHTIKAKLYLSQNGSKGNGTAFITKEIAIKDKTSSIPLIWTGNFRTEYYTYETIRIPFKVLDPNNKIATVYLYKNGVLLGTRQVVSNNAEWDYWEITNLTLNDSAYYTIKVGTEPYDYSRNFTFDISIDPLRDMKLARQSDLRVNFVATGRSNSESKLSRETLEINGKYAEFKNFNWYNNGWLFDENNVTCLRISNGAEVSIPIGSLEFDNGSAISTHTIEIQFKIRNPQNYSKVITKYTRYKASAESGKDWSDEDAWAAFNNQNTYVNYDEFLTKYLPEHPEAPSYDELTYDRLEQVFNLNNLVCAYGSETSPLGIYFSPQDATFTANGGQETVSVDFVENKMLNLTFVYTKTKEGISGGNSRLLEIFMNGILTSVARRSKSTSMWKIDSDVIKFMSNNCDIDLYSIRVYDTDLSISEVVQNYAFDTKNIKYWDQKDLYDFQSELQDEIFSFQRMKAYNNNHQDEPLMPYIILRTTESGKNATGNRLPYSKDKEAQVGTLEFVNVPLDAAYARGELDSIVDPKKWPPIMEKDSEGHEKVKYTSVQNYYMHHCPSFITPIDGCTFQVQGTSSRNYPRRNYKAKCKNAMYMNKGPFEKMYQQDKGNDTLNTDSNCFLEFFYMDNKTVGTNKFTLKVDFMESSGDYNRGFANFVNETYSNHPLKDYNDSNTFCVYAKPEEAKEYIEGNLYKYYNHKGNIKVADGKEDNLIIKSKADFDMGPVALYKKLMVENSTVYKKIKVIEDVTSPYYNKWYLNKEAGYSDYSVSNLEDYRTSVKGYPVLAFHWPSTSTNNYEESDITYIGKYNMLLDKGSDECYGFKLGKSVLQSQIKNNPPVRSIAECWEFQNNSRTYCSFRDPWSRYKLSFRPPVMDENNGVTTKGAPMVADSFEVRYNANDDLISKALFECKNTAAGSYSEKLPEWINEIANTAPDRLEIKEVLDETGQKNTEITITNPGQEPVKFDSSNANTSRELLLALMSNWEDAVSWVWSTCLDCTIDFGDIKDEVHSIGEYTPIEGLAEALYEVGKYYIVTGVSESGNDIYEISNDDFDVNKKYYKLKNDAKYEVISLTNNEDKVYKVNTYYLLQDEAKDIYVISTDKFNINETYYSLAQNEDSINDRWLLPKPVTYGGITYHKDSKEYRQAKFKNELSNYFNIEYLATYFLMTEIFECYDSRGKNAMFASWGPQKNNIEKSTGNQHYIWYPIFYDIDTQLGINNTGIPSFEYYIDATIDGSFSTNDSVLWNNFYRFFKSKIVDKYQQLMGFSNGSYDASKVTQIFAKNSNTNSDKSETVDKWYKTDPSVFPNSYAVKGDRPLLALNLDEEYKYIIPTNSKAENNIKFGRLTNEGKYSVETDQYFYALQGDRNLYRAQFLSNRLNYIDSWLTVDDYASGSGGNFIRSRISANNPKNTSDKWIEGTESFGLITSPYWKDDIEYGTKNHMFDGEYWIEVKPARNSYVTVGTDGANFPSKKYNGLTSVKISAPDLKKGIKSSPNYREQLYYIYGLGQMKSLGDLSKLYFQEFSMEGKANKMTDLLLGYDGLAIEDGKTYKYENKDVNNWSYPSEGMPLLKEMNLCNITFKNAQPTLDLTKSEKLENFRNTGSNIPRVEFAKGVALNTLYLTSETNYLTLIEANLLNKLITTYVNPTLNSAKRLVVADENRGLYIQNLTDKDDDQIETKIKTMDIEGGNLGYYSYELLRRYYLGCKKSNLKDCEINFIDVQWSPYRLLNDDKIKLDPDNIQYFKDNGHFQLDAIDSNEVNNITSLDIKNGLIYYLDKSVSGYEEIHNKLTNYTDLLKKIYDESQVYSKNNIFKGINQSNPNITGIVYIENDEAIDEHIIQNELQSIYPNLTIFVKNVNKEYSIKFIVEEIDEDGKVIAQEILKTQKLIKNSDGSSSQIFFDDPTDKTKNNYISFGTLQEKRPIDDFKGWKDENDNYIITVEKDINKKDYISSNNWNKLRLDSGKLDYIFIAGFKRKSYEITFVNGDGVSKITKTYLYGTKITVPDNFYYFKNGNDDFNTDESRMEQGLISFETTWKQTGWAADDPKGIRIDLNKQLAYADRTFYAVGELVNVYDNILENDDNHKYYEIAKDTINNIYYIRFYDICKYLGGKITLPSTYNGEPISRIYNELGNSTVSTFIKNTNITGIYFSPKANNKISIIDKNVFSDARNLQYFEFSDCLEKIGENAFLNAKLDQVERIPYSSSLKGLSIGRQAFYNTYIGGRTKSFILEGCKDGVLSLGDSAFAHLHIIERNSGGIYSVTGPLLIQLGTNKYPLTQLSSISNALLQTSGYGPTESNKYTGTIRYYYRAQFESTVVPVMNEMINRIIASNCQYTIDPIVR